MIICLTTFNNRLAAVFESADHYALYQWQHNSCRLLGNVFSGAVPITQKTDLLTHHCVSRLICGAICGCDMRIMQEAGIEVVPWICGTVDEVITALCTQRLETLKMPGCVRHSTLRNDNAPTIPASSRYPEQHRLRKGCPKLAGNTHTISLQEPASENPIAGDQTDEDN